VILVDLDTGKLIGLVPERKSKAIEELLKSWESEILEQIEEVSMDLYKMYKSVFHKLCTEPQNLGMINRQEIQLFCSHRSSQELGLKIFLNREN